MPNEENRRRSRREGKNQKRKVRGEEKKKGNKEKKRKIFKQCVVFVLEKVDSGGAFDSMEFYAFDEDFISMESGEEHYLIYEGEADEDTILENRDSIARPFTKVDHCHQLGGYASWRNCFYKIGGCYRRCNKIGHDDIDYFVGRHNTYVAECWDSVKRSWTRLPVMNGCRVNAHAHVVGNTLFAVGGYGSLGTYEEVKDSFPFMEQLHLGKNCSQWTPVEIPLPPRKVDLHHYLSATIATTTVIGGPGILFGFGYSKCFYLYTPPDRWELVPRLRVDPNRLDGLTCRLTHPAVVIGEHLLWYNRFKFTLIGLNIRSGKYVTISLPREGLLPDPYVYDLSDLDPKLVVVDNVLVLIWTDEHSYTPERDRKQITVDNEFSAYHCTRFVVDFDKAHSSGGFPTTPCITVLSDKMCIAPSHGYHFVAAAFTANLCVDDSINKLKRKTELKRKKDARRRFKEKRKRRGRMLRTI